MEKISAVIITFNEENNIERCIKSLKDVADEIIVMDSHSTDRTKQICISQNVRFYTEDWRGYGPMKNNANSLATHNYILSIDADEAVSDQMKASILSEKEKGLVGVYIFNRLTNYCGKWIKHCGWYPDKKVRLFPKDNVYWKEELVHETLFIPEQISTKHLKGDLLHYSFNTVDEHKQKVIKYATLAAKSKAHETCPVLFLKSMFNPIIRFIRTYVVQLGFLDGTKGFTICKLMAYEVFLKYHLAKKERA